MTRATPSDKTGHEGEWWRKDHADHGQENINTNETAHDNADAGKNKFEAEQEQTRHPT
jgi:hypothetical protein